MSTENSLISIDLHPSAKLTGDEEGKFLIGQDFRQVGLIKNPRINLFDSDLGNHFQGTRSADGSSVPQGLNPDAAGSVFAGASGLALNKMLFSGAASPVFVADDIIVGGTSGAKAYVDRFEADGANRDFIYWHQDEATGFGVFAAISQACVDKEGRRSRIIEHGVRCVRIYFQGSRSGGSGGSCAVNVFKLAARAATFLLRICASALYPKFVAHVSFFVEPSRVCPDELG